jgi:two-component system, OmpR family, sensor histidine kinase MtrB
MTLRRLFTITTLTLGGLAVTLALALVLITTQISKAGGLVSAALHSVRLGEEMELSLLIHDRTGDHVARTRLESDMRAQLGRARRFLSSSEEATELAAANDALGRYLAVAQPGKSSPELQAAFAAIEQFVRTNVAQADRADEHMERWTAIAEVAGTTLAAVLVAAMVGVILWFRSYGLKPVLAIRASMDAFARDRRVRVREEGPLEIRDVARAFNEVADNLERKRGEQLAFLAGVAHDLKNPLGALQLSTSTLSADPLPPEPRIRKVVSLILGQVGRLERMVGDLLDAWRIEAGHLALHPATQDLRPIARQACDLLQDSRAGHELVLELPDEPVLAVCDAARLEQVMGNLISNAIKYSPEGGRVIVKVTQSPSAAVVAVTDQGVGISAADQASLFEPFRRVGPRRDIPGLGLGLSVARRIVEAHGGEIAIASRPGEGSTFRVVLPRPGA